MTSQFHFGLPAKIRHVVNMNLPATLAIQRDGTHGGKQQRNHLPSPNLTLAISFRFFDLSRLSRFVNCLFSPCKKKFLPKNFGRKNFFRIIFVKVGEKFSLNPRAIQCAAHTLGRRKHFLTLGVIQVNLKGTHNAGSANHAGNRESHVANTVLAV